MGRKLKPISELSDRGLRARIQREERQKREQSTRTITQYQRQAAIDAGTSYCIILPGGKRLLTNAFDDEQRRDAERSNTQVVNWSDEDEGEIDLDAEIPIYEDGAASTSKTPLDEDRSGRGDKGPGSNDLTETDDLPRSGPSGNDDTAPSEDMPGGDAGGAIDGPDGADDAAARTEDKSDSPASQNGQSPGTTEARSASGLHVTDV